MFIQKIDEKALFLSYLLVSWNYVWNDFFFCYEWIEDQYVLISKSTSLIYKNIFREKNFFMESALIKLLH